MREVEGIVLTAVVDEEIPQEWLLGPQRIHSEYGHEKLVSNGIELFATEEEARFEQRQIHERFRDFSNGYVNSSGLSYMRMVIAETEDETYHLDQHGLYVLITKQMFDYVELWGRAIDGVETMGHVLVSPLELNGFKPILEFERALHWMEQSHRQHRNYPQLANFEFQRMSQGSFSYQKRLC